MQQNQDPNAITLLQKMPDHEIDIRSLDSGDYLVGEGVIVERKAAADLISTIQDGRFISQCQLMMETYNKVIYIIEGDIAKVKHPLPPAAIHGALSYLSILCGASLIPSTSPADTASLVSTMARHIQKGLGYVPALRVDKPKGGEHSKLYVLEGLPGVGGKKAQDILAHFGSVEKAFSTSREEWLSVPNMGKASVDKIFAVIHDK